MKKSGPELKPRLDLLDFPAMAATADLVPTGSGCHLFYTVYVCELGEASGEESEDTSK